MRNSNNESCMCDPCKRTRRREAQAHGEKISPVDSPPALAPPINLASLSEEEQELVGNALTVRDANSAIALGLQGVVDVLETEGASMFAALPHYDSIERASASAQYAIEKSLPLRQRARHRSDAALIFVVIALALLLGWIWN